MKQIDMTMSSMFFVTGLSNCAYALIAPFLPFQFEKKGISQAFVGQIFAIYSIAVILCSPLIGKWIPIYGRRALIQMGVVLMGLSFLLFGAIDVIQNRTIFVVLACAIRFVQGFSSCCIQTTCYSIATNFYPEKKEVMIGYIEAATGIGLITGPILGSVLYTFGGYSFTFIVFGSLFLIVSPLVKKIFAERVDVMHDELEVTALEIQRLTSTYAATEKNKIGYWALLKRPRFLLAAISGSLGYFLQCFMEPILAFRLNDFNLSKLEIGLFFAIVPFFYIIMSLLVQFVPKGIEKRAILMTAIFLSLFVNLCVGPSQILQFPNSLWIMALGQALHGLVDPFILIPSLPEMIDSARIYYPRDEDEFIINDLSSAIFNTFLGLGQISAPLYASTMTGATNFRLTADVVGLFCLGFSVVYFTIGGGIQAFKDSRCNQELKGLPLGNSFMHQQLTRSVINTTYSLGHTLDQSHLANWRSTLLSPNSPHSPNRKQFSKLNVIAVKSPIKEQPDEH